MHWYVYIKLRKYTCKYEVRCSEDTQQDVINCNNSDMICHIYVAFIMFISHIIHILNLFPVSK